MSEKLTNHIEINAEQQEVSTESKQNLERLQQVAEQTQNEAAKQIETIKQQVEAEAVSAHELSIDKHARNSETHQPLGLHQELKQTEYKRTLNRVRNSLNPVDRTLSRVIHQPVVDKVSEITGRTIARPRGLLFGGLFACLGSIIFLYFTKYYGFKYNYLLFMVLFVGGYFFGLIVDLIARSTKRT